MLAAKAMAAYEAGREHFASVGDRNGPLSGEWAGESISELSMTYGVDLSDPEVADCFEDGFEQGFMEDHDVSGT